MRQIWKRIRNLDATVGCRKVGCKKIVDYRAVDVALCRRDSPKRFADIAELYLSAADATAQPVFACPQCCRVLDRATIGSVYSCDSLTSL